MSKMYKNVSCEDCMEYSASNAYEGTCNAKNSIEKYCNPVEHCINFKCRNLSNISNCIECDNKELCYE